MHMSSRRGHLQSAFETCPQNILSISSTSLWAASTTTVLKGLPKPPHQFDGGEARGMSGNGLTVIYDSADGADGNSTSSEIDVVAVHGLNFRNNADHARHTWTDGGNLWLRDFLPARLEKPVRVLLFEYNSSPAMGAAGITLDDHAKSLLLWLNARRKDAPSRPLVFVCHSMGGLVVKESLVEATLDKTYASIVASTCVLVFFATPHQGGNYASVGDVVSKLVRASMRKPNNDLLKSLKRNSNEASRRFEQFRHLNEKFLVISFYEGASYGKLGTIVDKESATLNLPGTREKQVPTPADHSAICKFGSKDDPRCELALEVISKELKRALLLHQPCSTSDTKNEHWCIPRSVNNLFTGRKELLERICNAITTSGETKIQRRFVITGIGGQGKSEICLKVANEVREKFWGVFWIDVSTESTATAGFRTVLEILGSSGESLEDTLRLLSNSKQEWLLILDNADDPDMDYQRYLPSGNVGAVIMTSRVPECDGYNTVGSEDLQSLSLTESISLLLRAAKIPSEGQGEHQMEAEHVVKLLGSHTLALVQAGAYIARGMCSLEEYTTQYNRQCEQLLKFSPKQAQSRYCNVYATFEVSAQVLETSTDEADLDALELLHLVAMLYHEKIPLEDLLENAWKGAQVARKPVEEDKADMSYLTEWHVKQLPLLMQANLERWDPSRLRGAQARLHSLALITKEETRGFATVSMHPLVHTWANMRQQKIQRSKSWKIIGCIIALSCCEKGCWHPYLFLLDMHIRSFLKPINRENITRESVHLNTILLRCCFLLDYLGMGTELQTMLEELQRSWGIDLCEPPQRNLMLFYSMRAQSLRLLGKMQEAVDIRERIVYALKAAGHNESHPDLLREQHELAKTYLGNGQTEDAISLLEHIVNIGELLYVENDPNLLKSQHDLAIAYRNTERLEEAEQLLEHVVLVEEKNMRQSNLDLLALIDSQRELAGVYRRNGRNADGIQLLEQVVKAEEILPEASSRRLLSQQLLASGYTQIGRSQEAIRILQRVVNFEESLPETHPRRLFSQHLLAAAYGQTGQLQKAILLLERVVKLVTTLPESNRARLKCQYELAAAYYRNGQLQKALQLIETVVEIRKSTLVENHPDRVDAENLLAGIRKKIEEGKKDGNINPTSGLLAQAGTSRYANKTPGTDVPETVPNAKARPRRFRDAVGTILQGRTRRT